MISYLERKNKSEKYKKVCEIFGINKLNREIFKDITIKPKGITLITGCSGSGKTTLAQILCRKYNYKEIKNEFNKEIPIIDILSEDLDNTIYYLNMVGLGEPYLYLTEYRHLSIGQQFRFNIAYAISKNMKKIYIDEFCSYLDRDTAKICAYNMQKIFRKNNIEVIAVSAQDDLEKYLKPNQKITMDLDTKIKHESLKIDNKNPFLDDILIEKGNYNDYFNLEKYHYFSESSERINELYNTQYYRLSFNKKIMGIITFKTPYSKEQEDKEFLDINNKLLILNRFILHPILRGAGITKLFFDEVYKDLNVKNIYVSSALAIYIPFLEKMGFVELDDLDYTNLIEYQNINVFFESNTKKTKKTKKEILVDEEKVLGYILYQWYSRYCNVLNKEVIFNEKYFYKSVKNVFNENEITELYDQIKYMKMKHYILNGE